jgi:cobalt-precorrin-5B (C1)-methyltransferase
MRRKELRSGYTTGACAAAAAKAATLILFQSKKGLSSEFAVPGSQHIVIPFPDNSRATFAIHNSGYRPHNDTAFASVIKDAGDDPDVTNGAEIVAEAKLIRKCRRVDPAESFPLDIAITGGSGVGRVTKPGLAVPVGGPAINPVPRRMIQNAVYEALSETFSPSELPDFCAADRIVEITISVTDGELLARKTLNERLGIIGGLSILGTTGIVRPLSSEAWTATIASSLDVAKAMGRSEIVLSAGRTSEKAHMKRYGLPEESYVMMGDYLEFALRETAKRGFSGIHLCAQWAKMLKIAMATPQTHVRHGAIEMGKTVRFLNMLGVTIPRDIAFNTAREIFDYLHTNSENPEQKLIRVCNAAHSYAAGIADPIDLSALLVSYDGEIIACSV